MKVLILNSSDIKSCLPSNSLRQSMRAAHLSLASNSAQNYSRVVIPYGEHGALGFMPAMNESAGLLGYKAVSVFPRNSENNLNPHQGIVSIIDQDTGQVKCILEGTTITALRTAAVSAAATEILSRENSDVLSIIGAGRQAFEHALAISDCREIKTINIYNRHKDKALQLISELKSKLNVEFNICESPRSAVANSDIVVTCTPSVESFLKASDFREGTHVNAIGACRPGFFEIDFFNIPNLRIFLDHRMACEVEADEIFGPIKSDALSPSAVVGEIGCVFSEQIPGRTSARDITVFKSVGLGIQDLYAADLAYKNAQKQDLGNYVEF